MISDHSSRFVRELHETLRKPNDGESDAVTVLPGKRYERFPRHTLLEPQEVSMSLATALKTRRSSSTMRGQILSLADLSTVLGLSLREHGDKRRPHPSGGGKYPLETYVLAFNIESLPRAAFHYRPDEHALEELWPLEDNIDSFVRDSENFCAHASALIIITAMWGRSTRKYGTFAFELALLEAGHVGQNLLLSTAALKLSCRPFGGYKDENIAASLDLDASREHPIYAIAIGD